MAESTRIILDVDSSYCVVPPPLSATPSPVPSPPGTPVVPPAAPSSLWDDTGLLLASDDETPVAPLEPYIEPFAANKRKLARSKGAYVPTGVPAPARGTGKKGASVRGGGVLAASNKQLKEEKEGEVKVKRGEGGGEGRGGRGGGKGGRGGKSRAGQKRPYISSDEDSDKENRPVEVDSGSEFEP